MRQTNFLLPMSFKGRRAELACFTRQSLNLKMRRRSCVISSSKLGQDERVFIKCSLVCISVSI